MDGSSDSSSPDFPPLRYADDSDPDEADIDEHMGPGGFHFRQSTRSGMGERHHDPSVDPVFQRFSDMIQGFGQPRRNEGTGLFTRPDNDSYGPPRIQRTTYTSGTFGGGRTSVTIFTNPGYGSRSGGSGNIHDHDHGRGEDEGQAAFNPGTMDPFQAYVPFQASHCPYVLY